MYNKMSFNKIAIVCVDDEKIILNSLKSELLSQFGNKYYYEIAESGEEALELIEELILDGFEIPIVISDCIMNNGMYGDEFLFKVREKHKDTFCVMLTGKPHKKFYTKNEKVQSIDKLLMKPWSTQELMNIVNQAVLK